jgi:hypothetical protein
MGVTIHYRGKLKSPELLDPLISEVGALAQEAGWGYHEFGPEPFEIFAYNFTLRGISINVHPDCETLNLIFDEDRGWLVSLPGLELTASNGFIVEKEDELGTYVTMEMPPPEELAQLTWKDLANMEAISTAWTKTQFAGAETHILLCKLLRYLEKKYFAEFEVIDEGDYYHTGDASKLTEKMAFLNYIIENAAKASWDDIIEPVPDDAPLEERLQDIVDYLKKLAQSSPIKPKH